MTREAPEHTTMETMFRHALEAFEASDRENFALRADVKRLRDELLQRDADDALRGARCACTSYQRRFHVAMVAASVLLVVAVAGWWR